MEDDTKAYCKGDDEGNSVRANFSIVPGQVASWELESYQTWTLCYFYGVVSSKQQNFDCNPSYRLDNAYGVDDNANNIYLGKRSINTRYQHNGNNTPWHKPKFPRGKMFILKMTADWREKQCKLSIFYDGTKLNDTNADYTILLPVLDDDEVLYPCVTPFNTDAYCIIRYA